MKLSYFSAVPNSIHVTLYGGTLDVKAQLIKIYWQEDNKGPLDIYTFYNHMLTIL